MRPGIVHRIDKDTSGVLVIAKTDDAHLHLSNQFKQHSVKRQYQCLVWGVPGKEPWSGQRGFGASSGAT